MTSLAPRHTIFFQTQMAPVGLRSLIPHNSSLGAPLLAWAPVLLSPLGGMPCLLPPPPAPRPL